MSEKANPSFRYNREKHQQAHADLGLSPTASDARQEETGEDDPKDDLRAIKALEAESESDLKASALLESLFTIYDAECKLGPAKKALLGEAVSLVSPAQWRTASGGQPDTWDLFFKHTYSSSQQDNVSLNGSYAQIMLNGSKVLASTHPITVCLYEVPGLIKDANRRAAEKKVLKIYEDRRRSALRYLAGQQQYVELFVESKGRFQLFKDCSLYGPLSQANMSTLGDDAFKQMVLEGLMRLDR